jgi:hypothetical protein
MERETPVATLESQYSIRNREMVDSQLRENPELITALQQAAKQIGSRFGDHRLVLDVFVDPEEELPDSLVIRIETNLSPREAVSERARLHDEWWTPYTRRHGHRNILFSVGPLH